MRRTVVSALLLAVLGALPADASALRAGAGRSDVTPPTGFYTMGYVRSDAIAHGQHTRLYARAIVLQQGGRKVALVATDLAFTSGGMMVEVARKLRSRGFDVRNMIISASHTHSGPAGYAVYGSDNFVAPTDGTPTDFNVATDRQLYDFLVDRVALAIERADDDLGPARAGWGASTLLGVTRNRSLEAFLANFGKDLPYGEGRVSMAPGGYPRTIDPRVDVLRVDRVRGGRLIPMGAWLDFADHGTVDPYTFDVYNGDHHGPATRVFESAVRREGRVPRNEEVVAAYGNSDAGDMSAGMGRRGPAKADEVGRAEARAMLRAWRRARRNLSARPAFAKRWTRVCFCGQKVKGGGTVASEPSMGFPFFTGSEENRGPLYDETGENNEGHRLPVGAGPQGRKIHGVGPPVAEFPPAMPLLSLRLGDRIVVTVPGEMTAEMGRRLRTAVLRAGRPRGVRRVVLAGYSNEFIHYFTTPEEYEKQHYEGGSTLFGHFSSYLIRDVLVDLTARLVAGKRAPAPYPFDATNGVEPDNTPYGPGAAAGKVLRQPTGAPRMSRPGFRWQGGQRGLDRPLDRPFVTIERRRGGRWQRVTDDLGLLIIWRVDDDGRYTARWQTRADTPPGRYRFVVTANRYGLASVPFWVFPAKSLRARIVRVRNRRAVVALDYPRLNDMIDLVSRRRAASGGRVTAIVAGRRVTARSRRGRVTVPLGDAKTLRVVGGTDRYGNTVGK
jgi:neutral ceramidase